MTWSTIVPAEGAGSVSRLEDTDYRDAAGVKAERRLTSAYMEKLPDIRLVSGEVVELSTIYRADLEGSSRLTKGNDGLQDQSL